MPRYDDEGNSISGAKYDDDGNLIVEGAAPAKPNLKSPSMEAARKQGTKDSASSTPPPGFSSFANATDWEGGNAYGPMPGPGDFSKMCALAVDALPAAAAMAAAPLTGGMSLPATMGVLGVMGAGGEAVKQIGQHFLSPSDAPPTSEEAAKRMGKEGLIQAAMEPAGRAVAASIGGLKTLGKKALSGLMAPRAAIEELPAAEKTAETLLKTEPDIASFSKRGLRDTLLANKEQVGQQIRDNYLINNPAEAGDANNLYKELNDLQMSNLTPKGQLAISTSKPGLDAVRTIRADINTLFGHYGKDIPLSELWDVAKRYEQAAGAPVMAGDAIGNATKAAYKKGAKILRDEISRVLPEVKPLNERYSALVDATDRIGELKPESMSLLDLKAFLANTLLAAPGRTAYSSIARRLPSMSDSEVAQLLRSGVLGSEELAKVMEAKRKVEETPWSVAP